MPDTILSEIVKTEKEAERIEEEARIKAREIIAEAGRNAAQLLEKSISDSEAKRTELLEKARQEAQNEIEKRNESGNKAAEEFTLHARERLNDAVELIFGRIVNLKWQ